MAKYGLLVNVDACIGCHACFVACKEENQVAPGIAWNRIDRVEDRKALRIHYFRTSCQHCENPACLAACPTKAVHKGKFGEVLVDQSKCIGCQRCLAACPYGAPQFNTEGVTSYWPDKTPLVERVLEAHQTRTPGKAEHCTLCSHRLKDGRKPACVEHCPTGALKLVDLEKPEERKAWEAAQKMTEKAGTEPKVRYRSSGVNFAEIELKA